jgi:excisionase family DNA binding protein
MDKLLTIDQLSEILQVKKATIYSWTFAKKIPHLKIGGALRFREREIVKWMDGQREPVKDF